MKLLEVEHFANLKRKYDSVGDLTWKKEGFSKSSIESSRALFTEESLSSRKPVPKELEVYALLSGIQFHRDVTCKLQQLQQRISSILGESLQYWVLPENLGLEYGVFKWPGESWDETRVPAILKVLYSMNMPTFLFSVHGIQINPDGCVVAKGYDEGAAIFKVREKLSSDLSFFPKKQSQWAHIPLGRILEPVSEKKFNELRNLISKIGQDFVVEYELRSAKFVHETRWYMEEKTILAEICFE
tara:strand:+ start:89 stop:817 length:729 start_codon:yes stop_codon:yes gene_type:complete